MMFYAVCIAVWAAAALVMREAEKTWHIAVTLTIAGAEDPLSFDTELANAIARITDRLENIGMVLWLSPIAVLLIAGARGAL